MKERWRRMPWSAPDVTVEDTTHVPTHPHKEICNTKPVLKHSNVLKTLHSTMEVDPRPRPRVGIASE